MASGIAALIVALAAWQWAALIAFLALLFRPSLVRLLDRVLKAKISKSGVELELEKLSAAAIEVEAKVITTPEQTQIESLPSKALPPIKGEAAITLDDMTLEGTATVTTGSSGTLTSSAPAHEPASEALRPPKATLILLSANIERLMRTILARAGRQKDRKVTSVPVGFEMLAEQTPIPLDVRKAVKLFWDVRNRLVHGHDVSDDEVIRAIDSGTMIYKAMLAIPRDANVVYHPGLDLFSDPKGEHPFAAAKGLALETKNPDGTKRLRVYPTTRTDYKKGDVVTWEWKMGRVFGETWYRDPDSGAVEYGWTSSSEFIGEPIGALRLGTRTGSGS